MTTNSACGGFVTGCITKSGGGCVSNGACSAANVQAACVKNTSGTDCIWDTTCKEKTCANAPTTNNTHELCTSYLSTCTVKVGGGCQPRTCANAPTTITTNDACEAYLPNNNCITKTGGGCVINTTCAVITLEAACIKNSSGATCFWDTASVGCKDKICANAPSTNTTHDLCVAFLSTCTVNSTNAGCVDKTCNNSLVQTICDKDLNDKACIWKGKCYKKECVLASSTTATHADCQTYHNSCTLSNTGTGCVPLPLKCEAITIEAACNIRLQVTNGVKSYPECGWNGSQCIDKACSTAPKTTATTADCGTYKTNCVANNPVNGSIAGCQDLPTTCAARKSTENCEITRVGFPTCLWNTTTLACVEKSCSTASQTGTPGVLTAGQFTLNGCSGYLPSCISNNAQDGCIAKPSTCSGLVQQNCSTGSKVNGDCYWNTTTNACVDRTCTNMPLTSHAACQVLNTCTVNNAKTACQPLAAACSSYGLADNCVINSNRKKCIWTGSACRNATCLDASNTDSFDDDSECSGYATPTETCTVLYKTSGAGCVARSANCSDYVSQAQCVKTFGASTNDCTWNSEYAKCFSSTYNQAACSTYKGTKAQCESIRAGCTNDAAAVETDACTFSCAKIASLSSPNNTHTYCQGQSTTCTINSGGTACVALSATCGGYTASGDCVRKTDGSRCFWVAASTTCGDFAVGNCASVTGLTGATHATCQVYHTGCTVNADGTACQEQKATCAGYTTSATCSIKTDGSRCFWVTASTTCGDFAVTNCASVTGLTDATHATCQVYHTGCTVNADGTACQESKATCAGYTTSATCSIKTDGSRCYWDDSVGGSEVCIDFAATHCASVTGLTGATKATCQAYHTSCFANVGGTECFQFTTCEAITGANTTWAICQGYSTTCSVKRDGSGCVTIQATCSGYGSTVANCYRSTAGLCITNSGDNSCVALTQATNCDALYLGSGNYSHSKCNSFKDSCTNLSTTGCQTKTCANKASTFTHTDCNAWLPTCTVNGAGSACITMPATCASQTSASCIRAVEGECVVSGTACVRKTCDTASPAASFNTDTLCSNYLSTCTVARIGGCQVRAACSTYKSSQQCKFNTSGGRCFWNPTNLNCVDFSCGNIEATSSYDSHAKCIAVDSTCTVRAANGAAVAGCMAKGACSAYSIEDQCKTNASAGVCVWNTNLTTPVCQDKSCTTAPTATATHTDCDAYFSTATIKCTVVATPDTNGGAPVLGGCQQTAACSTYIHQEIMQIQCYRRSLWMEWYLMVQINPCATAPATADYG
ncbi:unnamed protein product (macronuclear) [Paramecium tetraurelia]|uniref:PSI domain-containing protein n=1 Tax=Paramecium tetraurelia TaxID=5888 RepID=A0C251_PARTE|nr:uncharacterized protein GSPATT00034345001 [Paramecium tetraurelia]CAK64868.1 unnamed protein product [Paramecium tetraurelia]|eukprot:XP_001432265.1 hypothetical protein (macronuclear) [Paramecium tetraurelia strain d4-2]